MLYCHDGQNLFSTCGPEAAFGWGPWEVDFWIDRLSAYGMIREVIVVSFDCHPKDRYVEYRGPAAEGGDNTKWERHKTFVCDELRPAINSWFRTLADRENTGVLGSSMGGLASFVLCWERPDVFGLCAAVSPAFVVEHRHFLEKVVAPVRANELEETILGRRQRFKLYIDAGTVSGHGDDGLSATTDLVRECQRLGWKDDDELYFFVDAAPLNDGEMWASGFPFDKREEAKVSMHNEGYWRLRVWRALCFLYPPHEHSD